MTLPQQLRQQTSNCSSLLIYRPRKDERLSWPSWLTYSGWLTHISGHPSAASRAQDSERTPAKDQCYTAGLRNQLNWLLSRHNANRPGKRLNYAEIPVSPSAVSETIESTHCAYPRGWPGWVGLHGWSACMADVNMKTVITAKRSPISVPKDCWRIF